MPAHRSPDDIERAIARLNGDGDLTPLADLAGLPIELAGVEHHPPVKTLLRWGRTGRNGVYLDVLYSPRRLTWVTSVAALARFAAEVARRAATNAPTPTTEDAG